MKTQLVWVVRRQLSLLPSALIGLLSDACTCLLCKVETALETEKRFINVFIITIFTILTVADEINSF